MKNVIKAFGIIALVAIIVFSMTACGDSDDNPNPNPNPNPDTDDQIVLTMNFAENTGWNGAQGTSENWPRWNYFYQDAKTDVLDKNKAYVLNFSFTSNVDINNLSVQFVIKDPSWQEVSDYTNVNVPGDILKNTKYSGRVPIFPDSSASDFTPKSIYLYFAINNRSVATAPILSFSQFSLEAVNKETAGLAKWTVSGKDINVTDTRRTFAETISFQGKSNVFHIKPKYNASTYDHNVLEYDLSAYAGKKIGVEMSFDAWINKEARVAWQMFISPDYPLVCGYLDATYFLTANTWNTISGNTIVDVPSSGDKKLYLSGMQINGAEAYFANATLTITEGTSTPDTAVTLNSVTADGSASSKTTQLTLTFSQAIPGLTAANINLGSSISGLVKGTLSGSGPTYTLPVTGFTAGGTLSVSVTKLGYNITPSKTVTIYGGSGSGGGDVTWTVVGDSKFGSERIYDIAYNGSRFVAVGGNGKMAYSSDGTTWTAVGDSKFGTTSIGSIASGNGRFVAGAYQGNKMAYSSDNGITWTAVGDSKFGSSMILGITYGSDKFVAVGTGGKITYSTDNGVSWTDASDSTIGTIYSVTYSGSRFVAVGTGKIAYSDNGTSWTVVADCKFDSNAVIRGIAYGGGKFIAIGAGNPVYSTDNGVTWTTIDFLGYANYQDGITYVNNKFIAWGYRRLAISSDGLTWMTSTEQFSNNIWGVAWGSNKFVVVGDLGKMWYSSGN